MSEKKQIISLKDAMAASVRKTKTQEVVGKAVIKFKQGRMYFRDVAMPDDTTEVIVLASTTERSFFGEDYDPDKIVPPDCFAVGEDVNDLVPHENVAEKVNSACKGCPLAEFGTASRGKGPACKTYRRLAVIPAGTPFEMIGKAEIATCKVSPTSVKNWSGYATTAVTSTGMPLWAMHTVIKCQPDPKTMQKITFSAGEVITDEKYLNALLTRIAEAEDLVAEPYTYEEPEEDDGKKKKF